MPGKVVLRSSLDYHRAYREGAFTPSDVVEALLPLIRREGKDVSRHATAFLSVKAELVRKAAAASTKRWEAGEPLSLMDGVPMVSLILLTSSRCVLQ